MTSRPPDPDDGKSSSSANPSGASGQSLLKDESMRHNVSACPICGGGLCGVRAFFDSSGSLSHGLVVCDECEAIWLQPDTNGVHVYADSESPMCPVSGLGLYDRLVSRWANEDDITKLGWSESINTELTFDPSGATEPDDGVNDTSDDAQGANEI